MKLVIGGSFQGKLNYAKKTFGLEEWLDGNTVPETSCSGPGGSFIFMIL